jgi:hypothetical protein
MIKVFLILASVVLLGSAVLGWMNREDFIATREAKDADNEAIAKQNKSTDDEIGTLNTQYEKLNATHLEFDEANEQTKRYSDNIAEQDRVLSKAMADKSILMDEKAKYDQAVEDLQLKFKGVTLDELPARIEEMKQELADAQKKEKELTLTVAAMTKRVEKNETTIDTFSQRQAERGRGIALNGTEGTITAVNQDWGFAVINIGKNQGVSADSELIVKRGADVVGKLNIVSIEPRLTVADIRMDTLKKGARILPGDRVIFEKLQN